MIYVMWLFVGLPALATFFYFSRRNSGKAYVATAAISAIAAIMLGYFGVMATGLPTVLIAFLLRREPDKILGIVEPSTLVVIACGILAIVACTLIYRLAVKMVSSERYAANTSSLGAYESGRVPQLLELMFNHFVFVFRGQRDSVVGPLGEDPYMLPPLQQVPAWADFSFDLLIQMEPNLVRESFRPLRERQFYTVIEDSPFPPNPSTTWLVQPVAEDDDMAAVLRRFEGLAPQELMAASNLRVVICMQSREARDEVIGAWGAHPVRLVTEGELVQRSLDLTYYVSSLNQRFRKQSIAGVDYTLEDCFVRPR
ncbi:hypothetical protein HNP52_002732 [Sphingomonas kyeonggiensis]|uniref:Uncharacterized protein n=1 Tax=Sphingomonas kyeonggiensis TaxID=1268553 RepID=A0A7W7K2B6_9SPHN|nr:hypothetical protein [Sphingomonas kyeonggiensis]MBB4839663.1 hypothetical protein [Sphingomonas kyeonggiensis]